MGHFDRFLDSGKDLWRNPSVWGVLIAQYVLFLLLMLLVGAIDFFLLLAINADTLAPLAVDPSSVPPEALVNAIWNPTTFIVMGIVIAIEFVLLMIVAAWFTAGAYGMIRNLLLDGSTTIREFFPNAKRFVWKIWRFSLLRLALLAIPLIPFLYTFATLIGTTPGFATTTQLTLFLITLGVLTIVGLLVALLFLYGDAVIVFEDVDAIPAAKRTLALVRQNLGVSVVTGLLALASVILFSIVLGLLIMPVQVTADARQTTGWIVASETLSVLQNAILVALGAIVTIFIFRTYRLVTGGVVRTSPYRTKKHKKKA